MRVNTLAGVLFFAAAGGTLLFFGALQARADNFTIYAQPDDSGEMLSQQATFANTWISASLGNLFLGKSRLSITFTMQDLHANVAKRYPSGGVALGTCPMCEDLQKYYFTDADRTLLADGAFHTFTVQTGTTTLGIADGETPIYIKFFSLSQYFQGTHLKSNAASTTPYLLIEAAAQPTLPPVPQAPEGSVTLYEQSDASGLMTNPQVTYQNAHIDSASLGNVNLGKGKLYLTFTIKDPKAGNVYHQPQGVCIQPAGVYGCPYGSRLQTYLFTDADRALVADKAFHMFMVETGTTTSAYADGTRPVSIGFFGLSQYQYGTKVKSNADATVPALIIKAPPAPPPPDPCIAAGNCVSNVLFLPGIKGSHLYRPEDGCDAGSLSCEDRLWEPGLDEGIFSSLLRGAGNDDVRDLFLDAQGKSVQSDVYVKEKDVLDSVGGKDFYASFIADMDALKSAGTIADWEPVAYDWRLSLPDIVEKGKKTGDRISYLEATSTPYIAQELRRLAASSKTGKVTIVAHSNGGLLAKVLLNQLGSLASKSLVDKVIMVGVPQSGAPRAVGSLLYGAGEGLPFERFDFLMSKAVAREFSERSPMAYHLLPSAQYFADANDPAHAVDAFVGTSGFSEERAAYGSTLNTADELYDYLLARDGGREKPAASDVSAANVLDESFISYARDTHAATDAWVPPEGITLYQIAGWGVDTVAGLRLTELPPAMAGPLAAAHRTMFSPTFVEDGDGVVPVPSALMTSTSSPNVMRYWVNLKEFRDQEAVFRNHGNIFEIPSLQDFIKNIIKNSTSTLPAYISTSQPSPVTANKKLVFILHSPLTLQLTDSSGNTSGLSGDDVVTQDIPGATYGEFGDAQYIIAPEGSYTLAMNGQAGGTFTLEMQEMSGNAVVSSATIANVPTTENTLASLTVSGGLDTASALAVDSDGDGEADISLAPRAGETVSYEPSAEPEPEPASEPEPAPVATRAPSGAARGADFPQLQVATLAPAPVQIVPDVATTTPAVASSTPIETSTVAISTPAPEPVAVASRVEKRVPEPEALVAEADPLPDLSQTASAYGASQQGALKKLAAAVYNGLYGFWLALKNLF